jgi:hypothetical protein
MSKVLLTAILILAYTGVDAQIVADHNEVDEFDNIPQVYLDMVKTMLVDISGESHSAGYRIGMNLLELMDNSYQAETYSYSAPLESSDQYVRLGRHITMGENCFFSQAKIDNFSIKKWE